MEKQYILELLQNNLEILIELIILVVFFLAKDFIVEVAIKKETKAIKFLKENVREFLINLIIACAIFFLSCFWEANTYILIISIMLAIVYIVVIFSIFIFRGTEEEKIDGMNYIILFFGLWAAAICVNYL